jgi:hypothetical protein
VRLLTAAVVISVSFSLPGVSATLVGAYVFNNNLNAQESGVPALTATNPLGTSTFATDTVFGGSRTVYAFNGNSNITQQAGLTFNDSTNLIPQNSYSVEMVVELASVTGYVRLLDFQNRQSDNGFYNINGGLQLYPDTAGPSGVILAGTYYDLILTNNGSTVVAYLNGTQQFSVNDTQANLNNANNPTQLLNLFLDNTVGGGQGEYSSGRVALFEAFSGVLSASDAASLAANPFGNVTGTGTTVPEPISSTLVLGGLAVLILGRRYRRSSANRE